MLKRVQVREQVQEQQEVELEQVLELQEEVLVLELSSYQTALARSLTPDVAVFTNLSPDHLDRHGGMGGYFAAKRRLFAEGGPDRAVIGVDEVEGRFLAGQLAQPAGEVMRSSWLNWFCFWWALLMFSMASGPPSASLLSSTSNAR